MTDMAGPETPRERAHGLIVAAERMGLDGPTEDMISIVIQDAEFDTLNFPDVIANKHGHCWDGNGMMVRRDPPEKTMDMIADGGIAELEEMDGRHGREQTEETGFSRL